MAIHAIMNIGIYQFIERVTPPDTQQTVIIPAIKPIIPPNTKEFSFIIRPCAISALGAIRMEYTSKAIQQSTPINKENIKQINVKISSEIPNIVQRREVILSE